MLKHGIASGPITLQVWAWSTGTQDKPLRGFLPLPLPRFLEEHFPHVRDIAIPPSPATAGGNRVIDDMQRVGYDAAVSTAAACDDLMEDATETAMLQRVRAMCAQPDS